MGTLNPLMSVTATVIKRETRFMATGSESELIDTIGSVIKQTGGNLMKSKTGEVLMYNVAP